MAFHLRAFELIFIVQDEFCHNSTQIKSLSMTYFLFSSNFYLRFSCSNYSSNKLQQGLFIAQKEFLCGVISEHSHKCVILDWNCLSRASKSSAIVTILYVFIVL